MNTLTVQPVHQPKQKTFMQIFIRKLLGRQFGQAGFVRSGMIVVLLLLAAALAFRAVRGHALSTSSAIKSGLAGYCLDVYHDSSAANAPVDSWRCNDSAAQEWKIAGVNIKHNDTSCLGVAGNGTMTGDSIVLNTCDNSPGQVWLRDKNGYQNPNSGLCLAVPDSQTGQQLVAASCNLSQPSETWTSDEDASATCGGTEGQKVACYAEQDWTSWQSGTASHEALLNSYTDGAPYEEWCADFVSYVYKQAGYPFSGGEADGWDQNIADDIQYMGFTMHAAGNYSPQPGDVAYFDYPGGHVEIVVSGGAHPTFIYGDSGTIDPATGNGQMEANTITSKPGEGQVVYYLSPDGS
jgi:hypothetical protein